MSETRHTDQHKGKDVVPGYGDSVYGEGQLREPRRWRRTIWRHIDRAMAVRGRRANGEGPYGGARTGQGMQGSARMGDRGEGQSKGSCADEGGYRDGVVLQHVGNNSPVAREGERRVEFRVGKRKSELPRKAIFG